MLLLFQPFFVLFLVGQIQSLFFVFFKRENLVHVRDILVIADMLFWSNEDLSGRSYLRKSALKSGKGIHIYLNNFLYFLSRRTGQFS